MTLYRLQQPITTWVMTHEPDTTSISVRVECVCFYNVLQCPHYNDCHFVLVVFTKCSIPSPHRPECQLLIRQPPLSARLNVGCRRRCGGSCSGTPLAH